MKQNQFVAYGLILSAILGLVGSVFSYEPNFADALYTLASLGLYVFGIWGAIRLLK